MRHFRVEPKTIAALLALTFGMATLFVYFYSIRSNPDPVTEGPLPTVGLVLNVVSLVFMTIAAVMDHFGENKAR